MPQRQINLALGWGLNLALALALVLVLVLVQVLGLNEDLVLRLKAVEMEKTGHKKVTGHVGYPITSQETN